MNRKLKSSILASLLSASVLTGCNTDNDINRYNHNTEYEVNYKVNMPPYLRKQITQDNSYIYYNDLKNVEELSLLLDGTFSLGDLAFLNSCINLKKLTISLDNPDLLKVIKYLPNLEELTIENFGKESNLLLSMDNFSFVKKSPNLKKLLIGDFYVEKELLESLNQIKVLFFLSNKDSIICNYNYDYTKLKNLKYLIINKPLSFVIHTSFNEILNLKENGAKIISYETGEDITLQLLEFNKKIDELVNNLKLNKNNMSSSINSTLVYISNLLTYGKCDDLSNKEVREKYYKFGYLSGIFDNDNEAICANYAALFSIILDRADINTLIAINKNHAFNIIDIAGKKLIIDPTLIDSIYKDEEPLRIAKNSIVTNLNNVIKMNDIYMHIAAYDINNIPEEQLEYKPYDYKFKKTVLKYGIISLLLIGALAYPDSLVYEKKLKEETKERLKMKRELRKKGYISVN